MDTLTRGRARKSEPLTKEEYSAFVKWVANQHTKYDAALILGVSRPTLDRIYNAKSGSPENIGKIRSVLTSEK